jgi:RNA polymerase sigma factor (sigma-70 family)
MAGCLAAPSLADAARPLFSHAPVPIQSLRRETLQEQALNARAWLSGRGTLDRLVPGGLRSFLREHVLPRNLPSSPSREIYGTALLLAAGTLAIWYALQQAGGPDVSAVRLPSSLLLGDEPSTFPSMTVAIGGILGRDVLARARAFQHRHHIKWPDQKIEKYWSDHVARIKNPSSRSAWAAKHQPFVSAVDRRWGWANYLETKGFPKNKKRKPTWESTHTDWGAVAQIIPQQVTPERNGLIQETIQLSREEEFAIARLKQQGNQAAFNTLIASQKANVRAKVNRYSRYAWFPDYANDLHQAAMEGALRGTGGLVRAVELFNPDENVRLETMANPWIIGALKDEVAKNHSNGEDSHVSIDDLDESNHPSVPSLEVDPWDEERKRMEQALPQAGLTTQELQVFELLKEVEYQVDIARILRINEGTVSILRKRIIEKLHKAVGSGGSQAAGGVRSVLLVLTSALTVSLIRQLSSGSVPDQMADILLTPLPLSLAGHLALLPVLGLGIFAAKPAPRVRAFLTAV